MRRIILASKSKARRDLLRQIGLKFTVYSTSVNEGRIFKKRCSDLVIENAVRKAEDAAKRYKKGVIISADTVMLVGKKIIGKPKNIKDAVSTLRLLSKRPQWVYTGIAVCDAEDGKIYTDYEKTKIYMCRLTDKQIRNYFKNISPLDKAGSFDIQGLGGIFIDRIEGCFYNVVGLPIAKLSRLLKKAGVCIL